MLPETVSAKQTAENHAYLPLNNGYFLRGQGYSQYQGLFLRRNNSFFKYIDELRFEASIHHVDQRENEVVLHTDTGKITIREAPHGLTIMSSTPTTFHLLVDMRYIHHYDDAGRNYDITRRHTTTAITYTKYETHRQGSPEYTAELSLECPTWDSTASWEEQRYRYDQERGTKATHWVFNAGSFTVTPDHNARFIVDDNATPVTTPTLEEYAYESNGHVRLAAGYPWFYQAWSRDEIISLAPLIEAEPSLAQDMLVRAAEANQGETTVQGSDLVSADTPGWIARRTQQLMQRGELDGDAATRITSYLEDYVESVTKKDGLVVNKALETWMDTHGGTNDVRRGRRVEIQAGYLCILDVLTSLTNDEVYADLYRAAKRGVRDLLVDDRVLHDGFVNGELDTTKRPNVFLAYYLHSDMVSASVWYETFDAVLAKCWLPWGGLSSIEQGHSLFHGRHSGQSNESYHRGDSWYYVNNIAALSLHDLNHHRYLRYIERIREASLRDYEEHGAIGACSEISDAVQQRSQGCFSQAWSKATLLELLSRLA